MTAQIYMNPATGSIGAYDDWCYTTNDGDEVNAVDLKEVIPVVWDDAANGWIAQ